MTITLSVIGATPVAGRLEIMVPFWENIETIDAIKPVTEIKEIVSNVFKIFI